MVRLSTARIIDMSEDEDRRGVGSMATLLASDSSLDMKGKKR
jgi:hypothetical protein